MKQTILFILLFGSLAFGCNTIHIGKYRDICVASGHKCRLEISLRNDSSFQYFFAYHEISDEEIKGKWKINKDTLILFSNKFLEKREELSPIVKNTNIDSLDKYLIRGKKLYAINKEGVKKYCYLVHIKQ
ncbi:MAG: hypothetical protein OHK0038_27160 [Flammeovirgaceae bacterium]